MSVAQRQKWEAEGREAVGKAQEILKKANAEGRGPEALSEDETKGIDGFFATADQLKRSIDEDARREKLVDYYQDPAQRKTAKGAGNILDMHGRDLDAKAEKKALHNIIFAKSFRKTKNIDAIAYTPEEQKALSSIRAEDGGLACGEDFRNQIITKTRDRTRIMAMATVINTTKSTVGFPSFEYEGDMPVTLEGGTYTEEDITDILGKVSFTPHKRGMIFKEPEELVEDEDFDISGLLTNHFSMRLSEIMESDFIVGDGASKPLGILKSPVSGSAVTGSGSTIYAEDIVGLPYNIREVYRMNGSYMMHRNTVKKVRLLRTNDNGANTGQFLWQPSFQAGQPSTLNGFPLVESEFFPDYNATDGATTGDPLALFGDWSNYWVVIRKAFTVQVLDQLYAASGKVGYRCRAYYDGAPTALEPFYRLNRAST